jgi:hypothetical protein
MKVHEYNEMMAYLLRPRQKFAIGGGVIEGEDLGSREGFRKVKQTTIAKINNFINKFQLENGRLPSKTEIKTAIKIDSNTIVAAIEQGNLNVLSEKEAKKLAQSKILEKRQELTLGKGKRPYVSEKQRGKGGKEVLWESEQQKNNYINDLKKRFEGTGFRPQAYDAPKDYLDNKQLAIKYFGSDSPAKVQAIKKINSELRKTENLTYTEVGDDEKAEGKKRRLERERSGTALLSDREKRINLAQDEYVKSLNDFFKKSPNKIKNYPKLIELINLSFDPKTGTIGSKNKTLDELKKYITSEGGLFDIEHISDLQYEKKNRQFPVNRQVAPQNINKGFLSSVTSYIKNNKDNPKAQTQIKNIENTLKKYGLRIYVPDTGTFGSKMIGAYNQNNKSFPNFDRIINNVDIPTPKFKSKEIPNISVIDNLKNIKGVTTADKIERPDFAKEKTVFDDFGSRTSVNPFLDPKVMLQGLSDVFRVLGTPSVAATFAGTTIKENLDKGDSFLDAATDKMVGIDLLYPELAKQTVGKIAPRGTGILSTLGRFAANPFGRAARAFTPIGAGITAIGLGKDYYDFVQSDLARKAADPEAYAAEQEEQMGMSA